MKKYILLALKFLASGVLLWLVLRHVDLAQVRTRLTLDALQITLLALVVFLVALLLGARRWQLILASCGDTHRFWRLVGHAFAGFFVNQVLPSTIGGDGVRAWLVYRDGTSLSRAIRSVILERVLGLVFLMAFAAVGAPRFFSHFNIEIAHWQLAGGFLAGVVVAAFTLWMLPQLRWLGRFSVGRGLLNLASEMMQIVVMPAAILQVGIISLIGNVLVCVIIWLLGHAVGATLPIIDVLTIVPTVLMLVAIPISIAGWGIREGAMMVGLGLFGISASDAVSVSVLFGLLNLAAGLIGGLIWVVRPDGGYGAIELRNAEAAGGAPEPRPQV